MGNRADRPAQVFTFSHSITYLPAVEKEEYAVWARSRPNGIFLFFDSR